MKNKINNLKEIADICENPNSYKLFLRHIDTYLIMNLQFLKKKSINLLENDISKGLLYYEILH